MRKPFLAGNWKMHKTVSEAEELAKALVDGFTQSTNKLMIAPPFTALQAVGKVVKGSNILLGAQNMASVEEGAHTGEVSVNMLLDLNVDVVILGHSERRAIYGESDQLINDKLHLALNKGLEVILCVGETLEERERGEAEKIVNEQVIAGLKGCSDNILNKITIAYEPVWAIGTGKTATPEDADAIHKVIRETLKNLYSEKAAEEMIIQYGGSVKPNNVKELMGMENIDGALVGGASLKPELFIPIGDFQNQ
jgi:triosephosphate isomerase